MALWQPHQPGQGKPIFAKPHTVRQRRSIAEMRCTVCGEVAAPDDRWWFKLGQVTDGYWMTHEAPVHRACADWAMIVCPHLGRLGRSPELLPSGYQIIASLIGGEAVAADFGISIQSGRQVVGALKLAWPVSRLPPSLRCGVAA